MPPLIRFCYFREKVDDVIGLPEVVSDVVIVGLDSKLPKLVLEGTGLLE